jgi:hypothetical protein
MGNPKDDWLAPQNYEDIDIDDPENPELSADEMARAKPLVAVFPGLVDRLAARGATDNIPPRRPVRRRA